jgi:subtilisin family serine protease
MHIERDALKAAFQSAPEVLLVTGAGNEDRLKLSGTSMAAPQVSNLAPKLFALDPKLNPGQVRAMILAGAERNGRVNLINPKASIARLGATPVSQ